MNNSYLKHFLNVKSDSLVVSKKKLSELRIRAYEKYLNLFLSSRVDITQDIVKIIKYLNKDFENNSESDYKKLFGFYILVNKFISNIESLGNEEEGYMEFTKLIPYASRLYPFIFDKIWTYNMVIWKYNNTPFAIDRNDIKGLKHKIIEDILSTFNHSQNSFNYRPHGNIVLNIRRNVGKISNHITNLVLSIDNFNKTEHVNMIKKEITELFTLIEQIAYEDFEIKLDSIAIIDDIEYNFETNVSDLNRGVKLRLQNISKPLEKKFKSYSNDLLGVGFYPGLVELSNKNKIMGSTKCSVEYGYIFSIMSIEIPIEILNYIKNKKFNGEKYDPYFIFKFVENYNYFTREHTVINDIIIIVNLENLINEFILVEKQLEHITDDMPETITHDLDFKSLIKDKSKTIESIGYIFTFANVLNKTVYCNNSESIRDILNKIDELNKVSLKEIIEMINGEEITNRDLFIIFHNLITKLHRMIMGKSFHNDSFILKINTLENVIKVLNQIV